jgi:hypothetical protein
VGHSTGHAKVKVYICVYINRTETSQINKLMIYLKFLEKQEQTSRQREIIKIKAKINENKTKKLYKESVKQKKVLVL